MRRFGAVLMWIGFIALVGCGRGGKNTAGTQTAGTQQILRYPIIQEPSTFDPARIQDIYTSELLQNVYEGLVTFDAENRIVPALAERWEISPDGKTYTFHLRPNAAFHNGRAVTAQDFQYSMERALWKETLSPTAANYLAGIVGVEEVVAGRRRDLAGVKAIDPHTLAITLDRPRGYFLGMLIYPTAWAVCKEAIEKNGGRLDEKAAIGTGPFKMEAYRHGAKVTLAANEGYWGGKPPLARIERPIVLDPHTMHFMYENSELDMSVQISLNDYVNDRQNPTLKAEARLMPQANVYYVVMHPRLQPAFRDSRVRKAFALAIDRDEIARIAFHGACPRADSFLPPGLPGCNPNVRKMSYDPAAARRLLAEAGFPNGKGFPALTLVYVEKSPELRDSANLLRDNLKQSLGIVINLQEHEQATFWADTSDNEKIPFYLIGWIADYLDPQDFLSTLLRTDAKLNHTAYSNPRFDSLCDQADAESDMNRRIPLYQQADQIAMDDVAVLPLVFYKQPLLVKPSVRDLQMNLMNLLPHRTTRLQR